jgi:hypothetical protein
MWCFIRLLQFLRDTKVVKGRKHWSRLPLSRGVLAPRPCREQKPWRRLICGLAAVPLVAGAAMAAQPLTDAQLDTVPAGFDAISTAEAQALGKIVTTESSTVALVSAVTTPTGAPVQASLGETTLTLYQSVSAAGSASLATSALPTAATALSSP